MEQTAEMLNSKTSLLAAVPKALVAPQVDYSAHVTMEPPRPPSTLPPPSTSGGSSPVSTTAPAEWCPTTFDLITQILQNQDLTSFVKALQCFSCSPLTPDENHRCGVGSPIAAGLLKSSKANSNICSGENCESPLPACTVAEVIGNGMIFSPTPSNLSATSGDGMGKCDIPACVSPSQDNCWRSIGARTDNIDSTSYVSHATPQTVVPAAVTSIAPSAASNRTSITASISPGIFANPSHAIEAMMPYNYSIHSKHSASRVMSSVTSHLNMKNGRGTTNSAGHAARNSVANGHESGKTTAPPVHFSRSSKQAMTTAGTSTSETAAWSILSPLSTPSVSTPTATTPYGLTPLALEGNNSIHPNDSKQTGTLHSPNEQELNLAQQILMQEFSQNDCSRECCGDVPLDRSLEVLKAALSLMRCEFDPLSPYSDGIEGGFSGIISAASSVTPGNAVGSMGSYPSGCYDGAYSALSPSNTPTSVDKLSCSPPSAQTHHAASFVGHPLTTETLITPPQYLTTAPAVTGALREANRNSVMTTSDVCPAPHLLAISGPPYNVPLIHPTTVRGDEPLSNNFEHQNSAKTCRSPESPTTCPGFADSTTTSKSSSPNGAVLSHPPPPPILSPGAPYFSAPTMLAHPDEFRNPSSFLKIYGDPLCGTHVNPLRGHNGNWVCTKCQNVNFPRRFRCNKCASYRDEEGDMIVQEYAKTVYLHHLKNFKNAITGRTCGSANKPAVTLSHRSSSNNYHGRPTRNASYNTLLSGFSAEAPRHDAHDTETSKCSHPSSMVGRTTGGVRVDKGVKGRRQGPGCDKFVTHISSPGSLVHPPPPMSPSWATVEGTSASPSGQVGARMSRSFRYCNVAKATTTTAAGRSKDGNITHGTSDSAMIKGRQHQGRH